MSTKSIVILAISTLAAASPTLLKRVDAPYLGCFTEATSSRALISSSTSDELMTLELCELHCDGYPLFGLEYGVECYCGTTLQTGSVRVADTECSMECGGDATQDCGAGNRLSVYGDSEAIPPEADPEVPPPAEADYLGCYTEGNGTRALPGASLVRSTMSLDLCAQYCFGLGYSHLGLEYGTECYCGNDLDVTSLLVDEEECDMPCGGAPLVTCGAGDRLNVYTTPAPA